MKMVFPEVRKWKLSTWLSWCDREQDFDEHCPGQ